MKAMNDLHPVALASCIMKELYMWYKQLRKGSNPSSHKTLISNSTVVIGLRSRDICSDDFSHTLLVLQAVFGM